MRFACCLRPNNLGPIRANQCGPGRCTPLRNGKDGHLLGLDVQFGCATMPRWPTLNTSPSYGEDPRQSSLGEAATERRNLIFLAPTSGT